LSNLQPVFLNPSSFFFFSFQLGEALRQNHRNSVTEIDFSKNHIRDKGAIGIARGFETMKHGLTVCV
jgi:hypothetical protein